MACSWLLGTEMQGVEYAGETAVSGLVGNDDSSLSDSSGDELTPLIRETSRLSVRKSGDMQSSRLLSEGIEDEGRLGSPKFCCEELHDVDHWSENGVKYLSGSRTTVAVEGTLRS
jgi:hypothetical protein